MYMCVAQLLLVPENTFFYKEEIENANFGKAERKLFLVLAYFCIYLLYLFKFKFIF